MAPIPLEWCLTGHKQLLNLSPQSGIHYSMGDLKEQFVNFFTPIVCTLEDYGCRWSFPDYQENPLLSQQSRWFRKKWNCESLLPHLKTSVWQEEFYYGCRSWQNLEGQGSAASSCCAPCWVYQSSAPPADWTGGRVAIPHFFGMAQWLFLHFLLIVPSQMLQN